MTSNVNDIEIHKQDEIISNQVTAESGSLLCDLHLRALLPCLVAFYHLRPANLGLLRSAAVSRTHTQDTILHIVAIMSACMFLIAGQMAGIIRTKLGIRIYLDPRVLGKSR